MGHVDGGHAKALLQGGDLGTGLDAQLGIEVRQWLVHEEDLWVTNNRTTHGDALTLTTGECLRLTVKEVLQAEKLGGFQDALLAFSLRHVLHLEGKAHVVGHGHVGVQGVVLEDHGDVTVLRGEIGDIAVPDPDRAGIDLFEAG